MRYGVLSDVHANLGALRAAVARLREAGVDELVCAGDLVGYGPFPNETVEEVRELGVRCVAGNHDLVVTGRLDPGRTGAWARRTLEWTVGVLSDGARAFLSALPPRLDLGAVVVAHGSLADPEEYLDRPSRIAPQLDRLATEHPSARMLVVGHTHRALACSEDGKVARAGRPGRVALGEDRWLLNPGSVGQPRAWRPGARAMVLDLDARTAELLVVRYDVDACRRALRERGLPEGGCHARPRLRSALGQAWRERTGR